jgi:hypothetical protein
MPLAKEVAIELRKLADALDLHPDVETCVPRLSFFYDFEQDKAKFIATANILPHPLVKTYPKDSNTYSRVSVTHETPALHVSTSIYRQAVCELISPAKPAVYDCKLTLSGDEDASLTEA